MAMTTKQLEQDVYNAETRQVAPSYDADVFYSIKSYPDYIVCAKCNRKYSGNVADLRKQHATPIRNKSYLDISCDYATWSGALATYDILN